MEYNKAIGMIETRGIAAAIEAADAAVKSANVKLLGLELTRGNGWVTVKFSGDVGSVQAAVSAGAASAAKINKVVSTLVKARPHQDLVKLLHSSATCADNSDAVPEEPGALPETGVIKRGIQ